MRVQCHPAHLKIVTSTRMPSFLQATSYEIFLAKKTTLHLVYSSFSLLNLSSESESEEEILVSSYLLQRYMSQLRLLLWTGQMTHHHISNDANIKINFDLLTLQLFSPQSNNSLLEPKMMWYIEYFQVVNTLLMMTSISECSDAPA